MNLKLIYIIKIISLEKKGSRDYVKHWVDEISLSFIVAFLVGIRYGIRSNDSTNNS